MNEIIPDNMKYIHECFFCCNQLTEVEIFKGVTCIEMDAFGLCLSFKKVTFSSFLANNDMILFFIKIHMHKRIIDNIV